MGVSIIGAGSIGLLFAAYLSKIGIRVTLYTRTAQQADLLNKDGLLFRYGEKKKNFSICAAQLTPNTEITDPFVIVSVKQHQLKEIMPVIKENRHNKCFLFIQNGMGHLPFLGELNHCSIILGIVEHGAMKLSGNEVNHTGYGKVKIASFDEEIDEEKSVFIESWSQHQFPIEIQQDWYKMLADKLVVNALINPLTAIYRIKNGTLVKNGCFTKLMRQLYEETVSVLKIQNDGLWEHVVSICEKTAKNESSMLRDIKLKRRTEIDAISGYILSLAKEHKKTLPYTEFVFTSIKALELENSEAE